MDQNIDSREDRSEKGSIRNGDRAENIPIDRPEPRGAMVDNNNFDIRMMFEALSNQIASVSKETSEKIDNASKEISEKLTSTSKELYQKILTASEENQAKTCDMIQKLGENISDALDQAANKRYRTKKPESLTEIVVPQELDSQDQDVEKLDDNNYVDVEEDSIVLGDRKLINVSAVEIGGEQVPEKRVCLKVRQGVESFLGTRQARIVLVKEFQHFTEVCHAVELVWSFPVDKVVPNIYEGITRYQSTKERMAIRRGRSMMHSKIGHNICRQTSRLVEEQVRANYKYRRK